jgi:Zn-dependent peptidase ImmA (M78 family)
LNWVQFWGFGRSEKGIHSLFWERSNMPTVNPQILVWARESAGYDLASAAKKLEILDTQTASAIEKLQALETGRKIPSRPMLVKMAKKYRRPLLTFYLSRPPESNIRGEDYRALGPDAGAQEQALVDALVRDIRVRQQIVKEALSTAEEPEPLDFIASFNMAEGVQALKLRIQNQTGFDLRSYRNHRGPSEAFGYLRSKIEKIGVFTLLLGNLGSYHTNLGTDVFRGFALADEIAPFVVVNDQDAKSAWPVTLLHEFAHLWIGATGISGGNLTQKVEKFCNDVASGFLLPEAEIANDFEFDELAEFQRAVEAIDSFAAARKVSSRLVAFRLLKRRAIDQSQYNELSRHFFDRWMANRKMRKAKSKSKAGGPSYYVLQRHHVGKALVEASERLLRSGELTTTKAARVLGVRPQKLDRMFFDPQPV